MSKPRRRTNDKTSDRVAGISRQAVLKHLQVLKLAGLLDVSEGFRPHYTARCEGTSPLTDWLNAYGVNNGFQQFNPYTIGPAMFVLNLAGVTASTGRGPASRPRGQARLSSHPSPVPPTSGLGGGHPPTIDACGLHAAGAEIGVSTQPDCMT